MRRISEFDGLRGLAALVVVAYHLSGNKLPYGWAAVDLFFVLSGYLITGIILRERDQPDFLQTFYARRCLRIWPIYFLLIGLVALLGLAPPGAVPWFLTYLQNTPLYLEPGRFYVVEAQPTFWPALSHTWSLAVEEQFYLIWPPVVLWFGRRGALRSGLVLWALAFALRSAGFSHQLLFTRCDGLALGAILAALGCGPASETGKARWLAGLSCVAAIGMLGAVVVLRGRGMLPSSALDQALRCGAAALGSCAIVAATIVLAGRPMLGWLRAAPVVYLGTISYGLYLYHGALNNYSRHFLPEAIVARPVVRMSVLFALSLLAAVVSWHGIEQPILRLKRRFSYRADRTQTEPSERVENLVPRAQLQRSTSK